MSPQFKIRYLGWWIAAIVVLIVFASAQNIASLLTDYFFFRELSMAPVFIKMLGAQVGVSVVAGLIAFVVIYANLLLAQKLAKPVALYTRTPIMAYVEAYGVMPLVKFVLPAAAIVAAFIIGGFASGFWDLFLKYKGAVPFGAVDPLLSKDISFYVFKLPFYRLVYNGAVAICFLSLAGGFIVYFLRQNITFTGRWVKAAEGAKAHILILTGILVASLYFYFQFKMYAMVNGSGHIVNGAGYADIHYYLPFLKIMKFICLAAALMVWVNIRTKTLRFAIAGILLVFLMNLIGRGASSLVQRFIVAPNEVSKETPYIQWSIQSTRAAYNLDKIEQKHFSPTDDLTRELLQKNDPTIKNIRLWDQAPLLTTFSPAPGDPDLLQIPRRGQRPVHDKRPDAPGHAVAPRARAREPSKPHLDQRAPVVHARLRPLHGPGQQRDERGPARVFRGKHSARDERRHSRRAAGDLLRRGGRRLCNCQYPLQGIRLSVRRPERVHRIQGQRRRGHGRHFEETALRREFRRAEDTALNRHFFKKQDTLLPENQRAGAEGDAVSDLRFRPVHGDHQRRKAFLVHRRLYHDVQRTRIRRT